MLIFCPFRVDAYLLASVILSLQVCVLPFFLKLFGKITIFKNEGSTVAAVFALP
jgi:hypothetical protein